MRRPLHPDDLTPREREVLDLIRLGLTNEEIAQRLSITVAGAKYHVSQILSKLGVATREEAAVLALGERGRLWTAWPVWARIAGATTVAAAVAGVAVLIWVAIRTDGASEEAVSENGASIDETTAVVDRIGSYDDRNNFSSFAAQIDAAVRNGDVQFFLENTHFEDFACDQGGFPARPRACGESFNQTSIPAVVIGILQSEGYGADRGEYERFIQTFLTGFSAAAADEFGDGRPLMYSYGVRTARFGGPSPGEDRLDAIGTSIPTSAPSGQSLPRMVVEFHALYDGHQWIIDGLSWGRDPGSIALDLDPLGAGADVETGGAVWSFWRRWD